MSVWHVSRGGSWFIVPQFAQVDIHRYFIPDGRGGILGLRLARRCL